MAVQLTPAYLKKLCRELKLYSTCPELNDILHLQCKGITKLENLDAYTGLKTLYLEQNAIMVIENLDKLVNLRCLYLGRNIIHSITGLENLINLESLDLSENCISSLAGLEHLSLLKSLTMTRNRLATVEDIAPLKSLTSLQSLDVSQNKLEEPETIHLLTELPLLFLKAQGNPGVSKVRHYRKHMLTSMPQLNYLDESPCFPKERRLAAAFMEGGVEAERQMREQLKREELETSERHRRAFDEMVERARLQPPTPYDPMRFVARDSDMVHSRRAAEPQDDATPKDDRAEDPSSAAATAAETAAENGSAVPVAAVDLEDSVAGAAEFVVSPCTQEATEAADEISTSTGDVDGGAPPDAKEDRELESQLTREEAVAADDRRQATALSAGTKPAAGAPQQSSEEEEGSVPAEAAERFPALASLALLAPGLKMQLAERVAAREAGRREEGEEPGAFISGRDDVEATPRPRSAYSGESNGLPAVSPSAASSSSQPEPRWKIHPKAAGHQGAEAPRASGRSFIWGTSAYKTLWEMALKVGEEQAQAQEHDGPGQESEEAEGQSEEEEEEDGWEEEEPSLDDVVGQRGLGGGDVGLQGGLEVSAAVCAVAPDGYDGYGEEEEDITGEEVVAVSLSVVDSDDCDVVRVSIGVREKEEVSGERVSGERARQSWSGENTEEEPTAAPSEGSVSSSHASPAPETISAVDGEGPSVEEGAAPASAEALHFSEFVVQERRPLEGGAPVLKTPAPVSSKYSNSDSLLLRNPAVCVTIGGSAGGLDSSVMSEVSLSELRLDELD